MVIYCIYICLVVDQFCYYFFYSQAGSQDQGCGIIIYFGIQISYSVADQNLEEENVQKIELFGLRKIMKLRKEIKVLELKLYCKCLEGTECFVIFVFKILLWLINKYLLNESINKWMFKR